SLHAALPIFGMEAVRPVARDTRPPHLVYEEPALAREAAAVAGECAIGADRPVARDHDRDTVVTVRACDCADRLRLADRPCLLAVAPHYSARELPERRPAPQLEVRARRPERRLDHPPLPSEILVLHPRH